MESTQCGLKAAATDYDNTRSQTAELNNLGDRNVKLNYLIFQYKVINFKYIKIYNIEKQIIIYNLWLKNKNYILIIY